MKPELHFVLDAVPGGIAKSCGLWYYTHVLAYRVRFGPKYSIDQYNVFDNVWTHWMTNGTLGNTINTMPGFGPFLTPAEITTIWGNVTFPP